MTDEEKAAAVSEAIREFHAALVEIFRPVRDTLLGLAEAWGIDPEAMAVRDSWATANDYRYRMAIWWFYLPVEPEDDIWPIHFPELEPRC